MLKKSDFQISGFDFQRKKNSETLEKNVFATSKILFSNNFKHQKRKLHEGLTLKVCNFIAHKMAID